MTPKHKQPMKNKVNKGSFAEQVANVSKGFRPGRAGEEELEAMLAEQQIGEGEVGEVTYPDEDAEEEDEVKELNFDEE